MQRLWKPFLGTAVLVGGPSYAYFRYTAKPAPPETYELPVRVRGPDGKATMVKRTIPLLPMDVVNARLRENANTISTPRPGGVVWKQTTAFLAANDPIEDANASKIVERDSSEGAPGDLLFFAVMDGHGGYHTSRLLSKVLLPAVALELSSLIKEPTAIIPKAGVLQNLKSIVWPASATPKPFDADPKYVSLAIQTAFANLDSEIINAPLRVLANSLSGNPEKEVPDLSQHPMAMATMLPAMSGSCAVMTLLDTAHHNMYVACTGDSRAVAGYWEETSDGKGQWKVDVLTEDQTGRNPSELRRMQSEHPADEASSVIMRGRVLGGLEPTRAFGDARYKWSADIQNLLTRVFLKGNNEAMRAPPALLKTPPYVTPRPVITHRKLDYIPGVDPASSKPKSTLRFVVLATDGLWDELSSEQVVSLVGGYLGGLKGYVPKASLPDLVPTTTGKTVQGKDNRRTNEEGVWAFVDDNLSTHLIRNAFGGGDEDRLRQLISIPSPLARNYRDDITCTVVYWEEGQEQQAKTATLSSSSPSSPTGDDSSKVKAKL